VTFYYLSFLNLKDTDLCYEETTKMKYFCGYYKQIFPKLLALVWHKSNRIARLFRVIILYHRKFHETCITFSIIVIAQFRKSSHADLGDISFASHPEEL